ncbi:Transient receptor potential cation channel subfamily A member 1 [Hypsibius exemplaris]|uniref:Transient receptor potential cation channel subfamily A member 1 n=1 Tax=Hypsibius exemplaris TaxID=2072580 RepID=A0A1W0WYJ1_HYPEX|nr:Transient receptor potential cation channel subfamily A member 1 [Hypsibius exemplaris]
MPSWNSRLQQFAASASPVLFRALGGSGGSSDSLTGLTEMSGLGMTAASRRHVQFRPRVPSKGSIWSIGTSLDETADVVLVEKYFRAVKTDNFLELIDILHGDPDFIHASTSSGQTALHMAAATGSVPMIDFLVQKNADVNAKDLEGNTPLHGAVLSGASPAVVSALLILKADPNARNNALNTPIHLAAREGKSAILQTLLDYISTDTNAAGQNGETALHVAASLNHLDCLDVLVRHRASVCRPSYNGLRPIHLAASRGSVDVLRYLLTDGNVGYSKTDMLSVVDDEQGTPLHAAVYGGNVEAVEILLENGPSIKAQTKDLTTPLHLACSLGVVDIVRILCEKERQDVVEEVLAMKDDQGMTPLHRAVMFEHWKLIMILINKGANLDDTDAEGRTPLVLAASRSAKDAVSDLLMLGADTTVRDHEGRNFLHYVVLSGGDQEAFHTDLGDDAVFVRLINEKDKYGCTPLHYAAQNGFGNTSEALLRLGASLTAKNTEARSPLHYAAEYGRYNTVKKLLETAQGFGIINDTDRQGCTALHLAARNGHTKVVQLLLTNGALIHKFIEGGTSLHAAVMNDHVETAELLVEHYSYLINLADKSGNTALHLAAIHNAAQSAEFLLNKGANLVFNKNGMSAMDLAIANKAQEVALTMVQHERWKEILSQPSAVYGWTTHGLIKELPSVMKVLLDRCVDVSNRHPLSAEYYEKYDYLPLQLELYRELDSPTQKDKPKPLEALNNMVQYKRYELIAHPVCKSYLNSKWMSYGIYLHFSNLLIYSAFLGMLTSLILRGIEIDLKPRMKTMSLDHLYANKPNMSHTNVSHFGPLHLKPDIQSESLPSVDVAFLYVVMIFTASHLLKKFLQISIQGSRYFFHSTNYFELICYSTALVFAVAFFDIPDKYRYGKPGIYVGIFLRELRILMKAITVYFIMIIAFSMAFCVLNPRKSSRNRDFYEQDHGDDSPNDWQTAHKTVQSSLIRISDMLVGDVDAIQNYIDPILNDQLVFPGATYFLALVTVGVITLLIQAILMGTAVYDLEKIEKSATINMLAMQVALHTDLESKLPEAFLSRVQKTEAIVYPNYTKWRALTKWFDIFTTGDLEGLTGKAGRLGERRRKGLPSGEGSTSVQAHAQQQTKLKDVNAKMDQHYELLRLVVQRMDIKVDTDVVDDPTVARRRISRYAVRQNSRPRTAWKAIQASVSLKSALRPNSQGSDQSVKSGRKSASFGLLESSSSEHFDGGDTDHVSDEDHIH